MSVALLVLVRPRIPSLLSEIARSWSAHQVSRFAASLAYYTVFSLAPLLTLVIAIAGFVFGKQAVSDQLVAQISGLVGTDGAKAIQVVIANAQTHHTTGVFATITSVAVLIFGASAVFVELQDALNVIWEVRPKPGRVVATVVWQRFMSFAIILAVGFLLLVSLVLSALITAIENHLRSRVPGFTALWHLANEGASLMLVAGLFGLIFKVLPDVKPRWRHIWFGATVSSVLFNLGKFVIGIYLGHSTVASVYGAAGSLVILMFWVYYSAQVMLLGAELSHLETQRSGERVRLRPHAEPVGPAGPGKPAEPHPA
jgi:membrane protein